MTTDISATRRLYRRRAGRDDRTFWLLHTAGVRYARYSHVEFYDGTVYLSVGEKVG